MPPLVAASAIGAIGQFAGSAIASHGVSKATEANQQGVTQGINAVTSANNTARQALDRSNTRQQSLYQPYVDFGTSSLGQLGKRYGIPASTSAWGQSLGSFGSQGGQMVTLKAPGPQGETKQFPAGDPRIQTFIDRGAVKVG